MAGIYLVENADESRAAMMGWLKQFSDSVSVFKDGLEAYHAALITHPSLLVVDTASATLEGLPLCRLLKSNERMAPSKVLLLCAGPEDQSDLALQCGADGWLHKPVAEEEFVAEVGRLLKLLS